MPVPLVLGVVHLHFPIRPGFGYDPLGEAPRALGWVGTRWDLVLCPAESRFGALLPNVLPEHQKIM